MRTAQAPLVAAVLLFSSPALADPQTRAQSACIGAVQKAHATVAAAELAALQRCARSVTKGSDLADCLDAAEPKLDKARDRAERAIERKCEAESPDFGAADASTAVSAAGDAAAALVGDVFGADLEDALALASADKPAAACQLAAFGALAKCLRARNAELAKCARAGLKSGAIDDAAALAACLEVDPAGKIARACDAALDRIAQQKCSAKGVDVASAFPACNLAGEGRSLGGCVERASDCRTCQGQGAAGELDPDCAACAAEPLVIAQEGSGAPAAGLSVEDLGRAGFPDEGTLTSSVFEIGPDGAEFDAPITLALPIDPDTPDGTPITVLRLDDGGTEWDPVPGTFVVGGHAFVRTDHLSTYSTGPNLSGPGCYDTWHAGGAGPVPPLHQPGAVQVAGGTGTRQDVVYSGPNALALGSTWTVSTCTTTVSGQFGPLVAGNGAWRDYVHPLVTPIVPAVGGAFSFGLVSVLPNAPRGPHFGLADPCFAPLDVYSYQLDVHFAADCTDRCQGVVCDDGDPCTDDACDPGTGGCTTSPRATCGTGGAGTCIQGVCTLVVPLNGTTNGTQSCAAIGLSCVEPLPVFSPPSAACLVFHPTASVTQSTSGWRQSVYCDNDDGLACRPNPMLPPKTDNCHDCPACITTGITCGDGSSTLVSELYVRCD